MWEEERESYSGNLRRDLGYRAMQNGQKICKFPKQIREHLDMCFEIEIILQPMAYSIFTLEEVKQCLTKLKNKKACGPDQLKPEFYKALIGSKQTLEALTKCMQIINEGEKIKEWEKSITKMIPKVSRPTAANLRPIALTDIS